MTVRVIGPTLCVDGSTVKLRTDERMLYITSPVNGLVIILPHGVDPGEAVEICSRASVSRLRVEDHRGDEVTEAPKGMDCLSSFALRFLGRELGWVRWR